MKTIHVEDNEIQQYALDYVSCESFITEHINNCDRCKQIANSYQLLAQELKEQPKPEVPFNLAESVISQLAFSHAQKPAKDYTIGISVILSIVILTLVFFAFGSSLIQLLFNNNLSTYFIICVSLFASSLWGYDMIRTYNRKMNTINFL